MKCFYKYNVNYKSLPVFDDIGSSNIYELILEGGLGDIILGTQFINRIKEVNPNCYLKVYFRDDDANANPGGFSWGSTRKYTSSEGLKSNPIKEWIEKFYIVDEAVGCNIDQLVGVTRFYPPQLGAVKGYCCPEEYNRKYLVEIFSKLDVSSGAAINYDEISNLKKSGVRIISLHLRRNADLVLAFAVFLQKCGVDCHFILLGSSEHQAIPSFNELISKTILIDSYSKNIDTIQLLNITRLSDLFIGGRGGFELFHWLSEVPSVNFFDKHGFIEVASYLWPKKLWESNLIDELFSEEAKFESIKKKHLLKLGW